MSWLKPWDHVKAISDAQEFIEFLCNWKFNVKHKVTIWKWICQLQRELWIHCVVTTITVTFWFFNCRTNSSWIKSGLNIAVPPMLYKAYIWKSVVKIRRGCIEFLLNNNINKQVHLHQHCTTQLPKKYSRISLIQLFTRVCTQHSLREGYSESRIG